MLQPLPGHDRHSADFLIFGPMRGFFNISFRTLTDMGYSLYRCGWRVLRGACVFVVAFAMCLTLWYGDDTAWWVTLRALLGDFPTWVWGVPLSIGIMASWERK